MSLPAEPNCTYLKYVLTGQVETYFRLGWMMSWDPPVYHPSDLGPLVWLMVFPCQCPVPLPPEHPHRPRRKY